MRTAFIGCRTIEEEVEHILKKESIHFVSKNYVESGLHNSTARLRAAMEEQMEKIKPGSIDRLLLCFGLCGNVVDGMKTGDYETILPKADDCITVLLGSRERRKKLNDEEMSYYLTKGWLIGEANLHREYEKACALYGKKMADQIYDQIFEGYQSLSILDTGREDYDLFKEEGREIARCFGLCPRYLKADLSWLSDYLKQEIDLLSSRHKIVIYPPNSMMSWKDFQDKEF